MAKDQLADDVAIQGDSDEIREILDEMCRLTGMGFAAVARVTDTRWIAAQVIDQIEFGLRPGDELELKTTICDEIRESGRTIVIDHVAGNPLWRTHHTPALYGFESYVSIPLILADGRFYGTLCAIDGRPRALSSPATVALMEGLGVRASAILSARMGG